MKKDMLRFKKRENNFLKPTSISWDPKESNNNISFII